MLKCLRGLPGSQTPVSIAGDQQQELRSPMAFWLEKPCSLLSWLHQWPQHQPRATSRLYSSTPHGKLPAGEQTAALHEGTWAYPSLPQAVRALTHQGEKAHSFGVRDLKQLWYSLWEKKDLPQNSRFSLHWIGSSEIPLQMPWERKEETPAYNGITSIMQLQSTMAKTERAYINKHVKLFFLFLSPISLRNTDSTEGLSH